ncbi:unnamed protein product [Adineta ricciae]|uniref:G-protein coupled receptors family 1 profile domain-containing protein n=1 Tax=Adineta ricciae TaxID=249248 RepID=A0A813XGY2_ADIRI|nr:unnamed protein product [Adineta ricciae]
MSSCLNNTNGSCLNGGKCISGICICSNECFYGDRCQTYYNILSLPFSSAMAEDTSDAHIVYIMLLTLIVVIGLLNNIVCIIISTREHIRITANGVYIFVISTSGVIRKLFLQTVVLTIIGYDSSSLRTWSCYVNPYISLVIAYACIWISVAIATERVLIECFNMELYETHRHAIMISIGCFIYSSVSNLPRIFAREFILKPSGESICMYDYISHPEWSISDTVFSYINVILPCAAHLICTGCVLTTIVRRKILICKNSQPQQRLHRIWLRQLYVHRDFLVPPLFLIFCLLPNAIHGHLIASCIEYNNVTHLRLHIACIFLLHLPFAFICLVYIYPNQSYRKEFRQTWFYRALCCGLSRKDKKKVQQRYQLTAKLTLSELVEKSSS